MYDDSKTKVGAQSTAQESVFDEVYAKAHSHLCGVWCVDRHIRRVLLALVPTGRPREVLKAPCSCRLAIEGGGTEWSDYSN